MRAGDPAFDASSSGRPVRECLELPGAEQGGHGDTGLYESLYTNP